MLVNEQTLCSDAPVLDAVSFGDLLRGRRRAAMLSQEELAERAGLSQRGISDLERGARRVPHLSTVRLLAAALALNAADQQSLIAAARPARQTDNSSASVPAPPTSPIGRETELADLLALLAHVAERLVALTVPAGVGKTRLALALAAVSEPARIASATPPCDQRRGRWRGAAPPRRLAPRCWSTSAHTSTSAGGSRTTA